jgi:hypothetical protein
VRHRRAPKPEEAGGGMQAGAGPGGGIRARWAASGTVGGCGACPNLSERVQAGACVVDRVQLIYDGRKWAVAY